jgi:hypothetical protein
LTAALAAVAAAKRCGEFDPEHLEVHRRGEPLKPIALGGELAKPILHGPETALPR